MEKGKLLAKLDKRWVEFKTSFEGLTNDQMIQAGAMSDWSLKDILGHVTTWEEELLKYLPAVLAGERTPQYKNLYGGIDEFNAIQVAGKRKLPLDEIRGQLEETHERVVAFLEGIPAARYEKNTRVYKRIRLDTYGHYKEHAEAIRAAFGAGK
jgi:hypothetical protein